MTAVTVTCEPSSVVQNSSARCTASAADQNGEPFTVPGYTWTSSDEGVAKVDAQGTASTTRAGTVTITARATAGGVTKQGQASLTVTQAGTVHSAHITADETWRARDNPHVVHGQLEVNGASAIATLTLEAGVEVRFDEDSQLFVKNGALKAAGTEAQPIRLVANQAVPTKGFWRGLAFDYGASDSLLEHVTLSDCGRVGTGPYIRSACLAVQGYRILLARDVTIRNSAQMGMILGISEFAEGSARISVSGSGLYPVYVHADHVGALPPGGTFTDNGTNAIAVFSNVTRSQTWSNLGIPYDFSENLTLEDSSWPTPTAPTTLTLSAGTVLRFGPGVFFHVGGSSLGDPVALIANGTAEAPVRFTSSSNTPKPGDWRGVSLQNYTSDTRLTHTIIEYAGSPERGNLNLYRSTHCTACPMLDHVTLRKSSAYGLNFQSGPLAPGSTGLTLLENGSHGLAMPADLAGDFFAETIPTLRGNSPDAVRVYEDVRHSQTWPNLGVPYDVQGQVNVGDSRTDTPTTLTLSAGAVLRFDPFGRLDVGDLSGNYFAKLLVNGTEVAPVRFVPNTSTPSAGFWEGVHLHGTGHRVDHAIITHAGDGTTSMRGNLNVYREDGGFVTNSTFSDGACGITVDDSSVTTDFSLPEYNNTFVNNTNGSQCR